MTDLNPKILLGVGFLLLMVGFGLPWLMLSGINILPSTLFLNFFAFGAQVLGLLLGMLGAMSIVAKSRNRRR
jgi:hypothetical protein